MPHDLTTANRHDHAWTENWAQNICTSEHANVPMELRYEGRQHERRDCLYTTKVKWKIYQTSCTLLDVGFVFILRRTDIFILIWACTAVLTNSTTVIFQIIQALKQNYRVVLAFAAMLSLNGATLWLLLPVKLHGRSYLDPRFLQWWSTLRAMDPMGVKGRRGSKDPC